jgi:TRAP-type C4-dicarboxylate transport system permease small subunit
MQQHRGLIALNGLKKLAHVYDKLEEYALVYALMCAVVICTAQVIGRYVFNHSISWSEELSKYIFVWLIWLGTSYAAKNNQHIYMEFLIDKMKGRVRTAFDILIKLIWIGFCVFLLVNGIEVVQSLIARGKTWTTVPQLKVWVVYLAIPVSQGVLSLRLFFKLIDDVKQFIHPRPAEPEVPQAGIEGGQ